MEKPLTLGDCAARGLTLEVFCQGCLRRKHVEPQTLLPRFGVDYRIPNLNGKLKCSVCTSTRCEVKAIHPSQVPPLPFSF